MTSYQLRRTPRHETLTVRGLRMHVTRWGPAPSGEAAPLLLLHGFQDTCDTFQFMVDHFDQDRPLMAIDWRGFGRSEWPQDGYWFPDYLADLDALADQLSPDAPLRLIGHSMGGNIASLYAGIRPDRVQCVVNLEGFGLTRMKAPDAPKRYRRWLDELKAPAKLKEYASLDQLASVIQFRYPRFPEAHVRFVAEAWSKPLADGRVQLLGDPRHRRVNPVLYRREEAEACWGAGRAPMLLLLGGESEHLSKLGPDGDVAAIRAVMPVAELAYVPGAGHMMHIEKPELVAPLVEAFVNLH